MTFNSYPFLFFILTLIPVYFSVSSKNKGYIQVLVLFCSSLVFYGWGQAKLLPLLLISAFFNSYFCIKSVKSNKKNTWIIPTVIILNLLILFVFKYFNLAADLFTLELKNIPLPVGISFFTFQGISLTIDSKNDYELKNLIKRQSFIKNFIYINTYIVFFPQLVSGPIVKAKSFLPQLGSVSYKDVNFILSAQYIILGLFFKMVLADNLKDFTNILQTRDLTTLASSDLILLTYGYSMQIYSDFFGYSTIALGLGLLFGYNFPLNFFYPYISSSFSEFWNRWHISLSSWLKEYLYIPLGGNRKGHFRTYLNLFIVMLLGGLWHGSGWNFLLWGGFHGVFLALERFIFKRFNICLPKFFQTILVFNLVSILWIFFIFKDLDSLINFTSALTSNFSLPSPNILYGIVVFSLPVILQHLLHINSPFPKNPNIDQNCSPTNQNLIVSGILLFFIILNSGTSGDFIYFQF